MPVDYRPALDHFAEDLSTPGGLNLVVEVGRLAVCFAGLDETIHNAALQQYGPFLSEATPLHTVRITAGAPSYLQPAEDHFLRLEDTPLGEGRRLLSHDFAAFRQGAKGLLRLSHSCDTKVSLRAMENYLRWIIADLALDYGGFVLHAAGVVRDGRAFLFFGPSGAGKSTVVAFSPGCAVLSDDLVLVTRESGRWLASTTPFAGSFPQRIKERGTYPLRGLYRLSQAMEDGVESLPPAVAMVQVLACCPFVADPAARADRLAPLVQACCRSVPPKTLYFRKAASFWGAVDREDRNG